MRCVVVDHQSLLRLWRFVDGVGPHVVCMSAAGSQTDHIVQEAPRPTIYAAGQATILELKKVAHR